MLKQKAKLGDGKNKYFHASIKARNKYKNMNILWEEDGTTPTTHDDIQREVLDFYNNFMGKDDMELDGIDIIVMRNGLPVK